MTHHLDIPLFEDLDQFGWDPNEIRDLIRTTPLRFDEKLEGFVCDNCATRDTMTVSNEVTDALNAILRRPVAEFSAPDPILFEIRSLAGSLRRSFLGHELKSFEVLASVIGSLS